MTKYQLEINGFDVLNNPKNQLNFLKIDQEQYFVTLFRVMYVANNNSYHYEYDCGSDMRLSELKDGEKALVSNFSTLTLETRKKLMVMGVLPNTELTVVRRAPMGDPLQVMVRGVSIAIRNHVASKIEVK